jgi:hypothetical protein
MPDPAKRGAIWVFLKTIVLFFHELVLFFHELVLFWMPKLLLGKKVSDGEVVWAKEYVSHGAR